MTGFFRSFPDVFYDAAHRVWHLSRELGVEHPITLAHLDAAARDSRTVFNGANNRLDRHLRALDDGHAILDRMEGRADVRAIPYALHRTGRAPMANYPASPGCKPIPAGACETTRQRLNERDLDGGALDCALAAFGQSPTAGSRRAVSARLRKTRPQRALLVWLRAQGQEVLRSVTMTTDTPDPETPGAAESAEAQRRRAAAEHLVHVSKAAESLRGFLPYAHSVHRNLHATATDARGHAEALDFTAVMAGFIGLARRHGTSNAVVKMVSLTEAMATFGPDDLSDRPGGSA